MFRKNVKNILSEMFYYLNTRRLSASLSPSGTIIDKDISLTAARGEHLEGFQDL